MMRGARRAGGAAPVELGAPRAKKNRGPKAAILLESTRTARRGRCRAGSPRRCVGPTIIQIDGPLRGRSPPGPRRHRPPVAPLARCPLFAVAAFHAAVDPEVLGVVGSIDARVRAIRLPVLRRRAPAFTVSRTRHPRHRVARRCCRHQAVPLRERPASLAALGSPKRRRAGEPRCAILRPAPRRALGRRISHRRGCSRSTPREAHAARSAGADPEALSVCAGVPRRERPPTHWRVTHRRSDGNPSMSTVRRSDLVTRRCRDLATQRFRGVPTDTCRSR